MKEHCPKCGPMPDRLTENPAWIIPAVGETAIFTETEGAHCHYECTYCKHQWDVKQVD